MGCGASTADSAASKGGKDQPQDPPTKHANSAPQHSNRDTTTNGATAQPETHESAFAPSSAVPTSTMVHDPNEEEAEPVDAGRARNRSKSVVVLQAMSSRRAAREADSFEPVPDAPSSSPPNANEKIVAQRRYRRLSSIFGEFSDQLVEFIEKQHQSQVTTTSSVVEGAGGEHSGGNGAEHTDNALLAATSGSSPSARESEDQLRRMFNALDLEGQGFVTCDTLAEGFRRMGLQGSWKAVFDVADQDKKGKLDWNAFSRFFRVLGKQLDPIDAEDNDDHAMPNIKRIKRSAPTVARFLKSFQLRSVCSFPKRVKVVSASPGDKLIAGADRDDKVIKIYDFEGNSVRRLMGHRDSMLGIAFSPDRKLIVTASRDAFMTVWDCRVGHAQHSVQHPGVVTACCFSYSGEFIYSGCQDNLVRKFDHRKCRLLRTSEKLQNSEAGVIVALACQRHADDRVIMSRSCDKCAFVLNATTLQVVTALTGHMGLVWAAGFNATGTMAFTYCDRVVKLWHGTTFACLFSINAATLETPAKALSRKGRVWTAASFCPNNFPDLLAMSCNDASTYLFLASPTPSLLGYVHTRTSVYTMACSFELNHIFLGDDQGNVYDLSLT